MFGRGSYPILQTVIVNTKTKLAFRGVLWARKKDFLILRNAELLKAKGETVALDGETIIERANLDFMQAFPRGVER